MPERELALKVEVYGFLQQRRVVGEHGIDIQPGEREDRGVLGRPQAVDEQVLGDTQKIGTIRAQALVRKPRRFRQRTDKDLLNQVGRGVGIADPRHADRHLYVDTEAAADELIDVVYIMIVDALCRRTVAAPKSLEEWPITVEDRHRAGTLT